MLKIISVGGEYRLVFVCDWCHKPITEDIEGNYMWRVQSESGEPENVVFLHTYCTHRYKTKHHLPNELWEWRRLTTFVTTLFLEQRTPLTSLHVQIQTLATSMQLNLHPTVFDNYVLVIAEDERSDKAFTIVLGGGTVILDLDAERRLIHIEVNIPREVWRIIPSLDVPQPTHMAMLIFPDVMHSYEWINGAEAFLSVRTNTEYTYACITLGKMGIDGHWIAVSSRCFALVEQNQLQALFVWLDHT